MSDFQFNTSIMNIMDPRSHRNDSGSQLHLASKQNRYVQVQVQVQNVLYCIYYKGTQSNNKHVHGKRQDKANRMYQNELHTNTWAANNTLEGYMNSYTCKWYIDTSTFVCTHKMQPCMHACPHTHMHACIHTWMHDACKHTARLEHINKH